MAAHVESRRRIRTALWLGAGSLALSLAAPAFAAEQGGDQPATDQAGANKEGDIIVTAQRRSERLEEVPMSVTVISPETIAAAGVTSLRDLANVTSGLSIAAGGAFPQPSVRGITTVINGTYENNVAVYVDGLYQPVAQAINIDLPNIAGVQVLKGPQGTLYGRNATGGAILLDTATPGKSWTGKAEATYGRFDDMRLAAAVAGPLSDRVGIAVSGYTRRTDSYNRLASRTPGGPTKCCATPVAQDAVRAKLRFELSDTFRATLLYAFTHISDARSNIYSPIENVNPTPYGVRPGGASRAVSLGVQAYDFEDVMDTTQHEGGLTLELDTGIGKLKSITGYAEVLTDNRFDFDGSYIPSAYSINLLKEKTFQQFIDYNITAIRNVDLIIGGSYFHDRIFYPRQALNLTGVNLANPGTVPGSLATDYIVATSTDFNQHKKAWAVYGDATWHATPQISINVGGRYASEDQDAFGQVTPGALLPAASAAAVRRAPTTAYATFRKFTPRASIRYEISPRTNVYFTYSQGFRTGAFNSQLPACVNTQPLCYTPALQEKIDSFEAGFKTAGRNFHAEVSGFYYNYKNLQVSATRNDVINGVTFPRVDITNAPKAKIYGAEASFEWNATERLTIRGSGTWLHARYGDGFLFSGVGVSNAGGLGVNTSGDPLKTYLNVSQVQDLSGLMMSRAPNFTGNIGYDYVLPTSFGKVRFAGNVRYTTRYVVTNPSIWGANPGVPADRQKQQRFTEAPFALVNGSITWTDPTDHYSVRIWGTNLTNHKYRLHYTGTASGTYSPMAEPLTFGGTIGYRF